MAINNTLITYDISSRHTEVKKAMIAKGYRDTVKDVEDNTVYLPNTSLVIAKEGITSFRAIEELKAVINSINATANPKIILERCYAVQYSTWSGIFGEPHQ